MAVGFGKFPFYDCCSLKLHFGFKIQKFKNSKFTPITIVNSIRKKSTSGNHCLSPFKQNTTVFNSKICLVILSISS
jgi:hypothetical protein